MHELKDLPNQAFDMGVSVTGTRTVIHKEDDQLIVQRTVDDVQPLLDDCAASRADGGKWGEGRIVGSIPAPIFWWMVQQEMIHDQRAVKRWFQENPHFLRHEAFIK